MFSDWLLAWRNLRRNLRRHLLTGLAIGFGAVGMSLFGAYLVRVEGYMQVNSVYLNHKGHVAIYKKGGLNLHFADPLRHTLNAAEQAQVLKLAAADPRVEFSGSYLDGVALLGNGCETRPVYASGIEPDVEARIHRHPEVIRASPELNQTEGPGFWDVRDVATPVSITARLAHLLHKPAIWTKAAQSEPQDQANAADAFDCDAQETAAKLAASAGVQLLGQTHHGDFAGIDAQVVSHHSTGAEVLEDTSLLAPLSMLQSLYETTAVTYVALFLRNPHQAHSVLADMQEGLRRAGVDADLYAYDNIEVNLFYVGALNFVMIMAAFFAALVWSVSSLSVINALTMTVLERSSEIGMMRAMGFMPHRIACILVKETVLLAVVSLASGGVLALTIAKVVNAINIRFSVPSLAGDLQFKLELTFAVVGLVSLSSLIITTTCAYVTSRLQLRSEIAQLIQRSVG